VGLADHTEQVPGRELEHSHVTRPLRSAPEQRHAQRIYLWRNLWRNPADPHVLEGAP
jgi:hypothetical protein